MSYVVHIEIFGSVSEATAVRALAAAAAASDAGADWGQTVTGEEAMAQILAAAEEGDSMQFMADEIRNRLPRITEACRTHGLSYALMSGIPGEEFYDHLETWKPGMAGPFQTESDNDMPILSLADIRKAAQAGETIDALIERIETLSLHRDRNRVLAISPEVMAELRPQAPSA